MQSLPAGYRALVLGASGAIGGALAAQLRDDPYCAKMLTLGRSSTPAVDFDAPPSIAEAAHSLFTQGPWNLVLVATGMLQGPTGKPEKRLTDLSAEHMAASFAVNTIGPALALAHFAPQLAHGERSVLAVLSAKVGSIGDNRLGGWYSYRASKAALNMVVKTAAIELARTHPQSVVAALHPGTVDLGNPHNDWKETHHANSAHRRHRSDRAGHVPALAAPGPRPFCLEPRPGASAALVQRRAGHRTAASA